MCTRVIKATVGFAGHKAQNSLTDQNGAGPEAHEEIKNAQKLVDFQLTLGSQTTELINAPNLGIVTNNSDGY